MLNLWHRKQKENNGVRLTYFDQNCNQESEPESLSGID